MRWPIATIDLAVHRWSCAGYDYRTDSLRTPKIASFSSNPGISLPAGLGDDGLPVGMQILAERGQDRLLLRVAQAFERARPYPRWPAVPQGTP